MPATHTVRPVDEPKPTLPSPILQPYLTEDQLAQALLVTRRTVRDWRERGFVPFLKIRGTIRFDLAAVKRALETKFTVHQVHTPKRRKLRRTNRKKL